MYLKNKTATGWMEHLLLGSNSSVAVFELQKIAVKSCKNFDYIN